MNTRIFLASLFCAALLCPALAACTADLRPQVAQPLQEAKLLARHGFSAGAMNELLAAEAVPNQTGEEKLAVAEVKLKLRGRLASPGDNPFTPMAQDGQPDGDPYGSPGCERTCP